ncbi:hypothetical protein MKX07_003918 [Trichoderma sp. CBMAI-0711]|nr:hypothetical protein MKX07_003918 [Trichoderma sp. CBMAI-0711]
MSRAVDDDVKRALSHGDHEKVFYRVADALTQRLPELLEVEFLGGSHMVDEHTVILQDGPAIAVPKLRLVQAFLYARGLLKNYVGGVLDGDNGDGLVTRATAVILLMDPEHLTAANTRKRLLRDAIKSGTDIGSNLQDELYFIDSLLTSRLHRHTKSPTLWSHRQWLMQQFQHHNLAIDPTNTMKSVILIAAERHPRNYYAWLHARYLTQAVAETASSQEQEQHLSGILGAAHKWALAHHDDVSGWAFLMFFLDRHPEYAGPVVGEATRRAVSYHWRNEAVWYFLRNIVARPWCGRDAREGVKAARLALLKGVEARSDGERVLRQASSWIEEYSG